MEKINFGQFEDQLKKRIKAGVTNNKKLFDEITNQGFKGSYITLYRFLKDEFGQLLKNVKSKKTTFFKKNSRTEVKRYKRALRFETSSGEQAQVDWGSFGNIVINERKEKLSCFVFILGYSRSSYIEFTISQNQQTFQQCHQNAFQSLGIPEAIVYDNLKTAILKREKLPDGSARIYENPAFLDFARHYAFKIIASPPYWPRNKGKVEASVKYIRNNFMQGLAQGKSFNSLEDLNKLAKKWTKEVAGQRIHKTTNKKPAEMFKEEKQSLRPWSLFKPYNTAPFHPRMSTKDGFIEYKSNYYSVPSQVALKKIYIREINNCGLIIIHLFHLSKVIAKHKLSKGKGRMFIDSRHILPEKQINNIFHHNVEKLEDKEIVVQERPLSYYDQF